MTDTLTLEKLEELKTLALAATPGEWAAADWDDDFGENRFTVEASEPEVLREGQSSIWPDGIRKMRVAETLEGERPAEDAAFIAAANPACVLALISQAEAREGEIAKLRDGMPDLSPVIGWLNRGCDPRNAVIELQILQKRIVAALTREGDVS